MLQALDQHWPSCLRRQPLLLLWRVVSAAVLLCVWGVRAVLVPALAGAGAGLALAGSSRADEVVLNSVAIVFVFESTRRTARGEAARGEAGKPCANSNSRPVRHRPAWTT